MVLRIMRGNVSRGRLVFLFLCLLFCGHEVSSVSDFPLLSRETWAQIPKRCPICSMGTLPSSRYCVVMTWLSTQFCAPEGYPAGDGGAGGRAARPIRRISLRRLGPPSGCFREQAVKTPEKNKGAEQNPLL